MNEDHIAECALPRTHDGQCDTVPPPGLVIIPDDEACLGVAAVGDDTVHCALREGHAGACVTSTGRPLLDLPIESLPKREPRCTAVSPVSGQRCVGPVGHERYADPVDGTLHDHADPEPAEGANGGVWWDDDPAPAQPARCESRPEPYGWTTRNTQCELVAGHAGYHRGPEGVSWGVGAPPVVEQHEHSDGVPPARTAPLLRMTALNPQPVRVRFVDLPARHEVRRVLANIPANVVVPGGFALVVDRFRNQAHRDAERDTWTRFGQIIGAVETLCYTGELEIVDYLSE